MSLAVNFCLTVKGQEFDKTNNDSLNKKRLIGISLTSGLLYSSTLIGLNQYWYKQYPQRNFHWYNDFGEWNQMDKVGHIWTAYVESAYCMDMYKWAGVKERNAALIGGGLGFVFQAGIELLDGKSVKWGASASDLAANFTGSALLISQSFLWNEQKFKLKFSGNRQDYSEHPQVIQDRVNDLYGNGFWEPLLKDYNGQSYWLSFSPEIFFSKDTAIPDWLNFSMGYGVEHIYGGFENEWELNDQIINYNNIPRIRQYMLSLDVDLSKIDTGSRIGNSILKVLNIFKIPAPALCINSLGNVEFIPIYW